MSIEWISLETFNELESKKSANGIYVEEAASLSLTDEFLEKRIPMDPYLSQDEEYGSTKTWFGKVNEDIFVMMSHTEASRPLVIIGAESHSILADLQDFGAELYSSVRWIRGNIFDATFSVFSKDDLGVDVEIFRGKSKEDAETMSAFLNLRGKTIQFYIKESDNLNLKWGIFEKFSEEKVGESTDRVSAEYFGIEYTKKNNVPTFVAVI